MIYELDRVTKDAEECRAGSAFALEVGSKCRDQTVLGFNGIPWSPGMFLL